MNDCHARRRAAGLCVDCASDAVENGRTRCGWCATANAKRLRDRYDNLRSRGVCTFCGKKSGGAVRCATCRVRNKSYSKRVPS